MRFGIDGRVIRDHFPGIGRYAYSLTAALADLAPDDEFVLFIEPDQRSTRFSIGPLVTRPNVSLRAVSGGVFNPLSQLWMRSAVRSAGLDAFHATYWMGPWWAGRPTVQTCYDLVGRRAPGTLPGPRARLLDLAVGLSLRRAREVLAISEFVAEDLRASGLAGRATITVTPLAADERFRPLPEAERAAVRGRLGLAPGYVLAVGIDKPHKNLGTLIQAWGRLQRLRPEVAAGRQLVLAGPRDRRYRRVTAGLIAAFTAPGGVVDLGPVEEADLPALYGGAAAFAFPSRHEGFGLPVLEAMACGAPVLAADATSLPEVAGDAALLLDPGDANAWMTGLERVLSDPDLAARLSGAGLARAAAFSWAATAEATLAAYRRAAGD